MEQFLIDWEGPVLLWIQEHMRNDFLTPVLTFLTHLGDHGYFWIALTILFLLLKKTKKVGGLMTCSLLLNTLVNNVLLKNLVARTRPYEVVDGLHRIIEAQSDYSFPSGHTGSAFAVAVVVFLMCPRKIGVPVLVFAFVIAFSRLYVGVHFPTDVLGGALIGAVIAYLVCAVYRRKTGRMDQYGTSSADDFLAIAREENITRRAEQLHVTPPMLSGKAPIWKKCQKFKLCYRMTGCMCIYALRTSKSNQDSG